MNNLPVQRSKQESIRRKRLGQYFTGIPLARALAAVSEAHTAQSIIDPMGGTGDMLAACIEAGGGGKLIASVDIDPAATSIASLRFNDLPQKPLLLRGNAFDHAIIDQLPEKSFDLVITNPPYVRYQTLSSQSSSDVYLPNGVEIRNNLISMVDRFPSLDKEDRVLFSSLISNYSGLSDLAVPSWILAAMLTKIGGKLAMVVPETWLSRDYARVVQYLLLRWFRILAVVEDTDATWFPDALVKTTLLVAERTERRSSAFNWKYEGYPHVRIDGKAANERSIVGNLYPTENNPDDLLASLISGAFHKKRGFTRQLIQIDWISLEQKSKNLRRASANDTWLMLAEDKVTAKQPIPDPHLKPERFVLPPALAYWLGSSTSAQLQTLDQIGVSVGQGLRTGANKFFYVEALRELDNDLVAKPDKMFGLDKIRIPKKYCLPVLRRQSELDNRFQLDLKNLKGRVLVIRDVVLPEELAKLKTAPVNVTNAYAVMPPELAQLVRRAATTNMGNADDPKLIPSLSAVRTNVREFKTSEPSVPPRYWYMLPPFMNRHRADLFIARINHGHPKTILNAEERVLIDANFSTLWINDVAPADPFALLALLNSSWCTAAMELTASVLGGGALKLEATHLRRLPIPALDTDRWALLSMLGHELSSKQDTESVLQAIDDVVISALVGGERLERKRKELDEIRRSRLFARTKRAQ